MFVYQRVPTFGVFGCLWGETSITDYQCRMLGEPASRDSSPKNENTGRKMRNMWCPSQIQNFWLKAIFLPSLDLLWSFVTLFMATLDSPQILFLWDNRRSLDWTWPKMSYGSVYPSWINESSRILRISYVFHISPINMSIWRTSNYNQRIFFFQILLQLVVHIWRYLQFYAQYQWHLEVVSPQTPTAIFWHPSFCHERILPTNGQTDLLVHIWELWPSAVLFDFSCIGYV